MRHGKEVDKFNGSWHIDCWQHYKVRPAGGSDHPDQTDAKYCIYDMRHKDYSYTEAWVQFLIQEFRKPETWDVITSS